jgi:short-subunit dehydrogenase
MNDIFAEKTCIITGSSSGIGLALAKELLRRGAAVYMSGWRESNSENLLTTANLLQQYAGRTFARELDVRDEAAVQEYIAGIAELGPIDYLFANAGIGFKQPFIRADRTVWENLLNVNLYGIVHCVQAVVPIMLRQGHGHIINTGSVAGIVPVPYQTVYCATKYATVGFSESLRYELEPYNIKVTVICPGNVATQIFQRDADFRVHQERSAPPDSITSDQAALEILEGVEAGRGIVPVQDWARARYADISADPAANDAWMRALAEQRRQEFITQGLLDR